MSSSIAESEKISRKRKHEGNSKEAKRKKNKHREEPDVDAVVEEPVTLDKREKTKKKKDRHAEGLTSEELNFSQIGDDHESISATKPEKKRKKKKQHDNAQIEEPNDDATRVAETQADEDMVDAPVIDNDQGGLVDEDNVNGEAVYDDLDTAQLRSDADTCFQSIRMSLYLPIPAIAANSRLSALLTVHLSPLLLTYFQPAGGVVLAYHDPVLSARPESGPCQPLLPPTDGNASFSGEEQYSIIGDEFGASWTWLTVTLMVFKPQPGDELTGWTNAMSEGFVGLVSYNYFQTSISKARIPDKWTWSGPSREPHKQRKPPRKGKLNDSDGPTQETDFDSQETIVVRDDDAIDGIAGAFFDEYGSQVPDTLQFRVVDLEMIQAQERGRQDGLQLEGTLLDNIGEQAVKEEERQKWESRRQKRKARSRPDTPMMSGGLPSHSRAGSIISMP